MKILKILIWVPGLFWLFPFRIRASKCREDIPSDTLIFWHATYTALQLTALIWVPIFLSTPSLRFWEQ